VSATTKPATALAVAPTTVPTQGCAVLLAGYLAAMTSKATDTCRANLKTVNDARIAKAQDPFPDQCAQ
jgi:hypothetical protein